MFSPGADHFGHEACSKMAIRWGRDRFCHGRDEDVMTFCVVDEDVMTFCEGILTWSPPFSGGGAERAVQGDVRPGRGPFWSRCL